MTKPTKERYSFLSNEMMELNSAGDDVVSLQVHLSTFGYLRGVHDPGCYCKDTQRAVRRYQRFFGLKPDGLAGPVTKQQMEAPRCGVIDLPPASVAPGVSAPFVHVGCKFEGSGVTYTFLNGSADLPAQREREIVRRAFDAWREVVNLDFTEVDPSENPDIRIAWHSGNHGDGSSFDGPSNTLAHAFFPGTCGGSHAGDLHFDEAETWIDEQDSADAGIFLYQVAVHEIGHNLGLRHSADREAIMFPTYAANRENLGEDDINGIQALYGAPVATRMLKLAASDNGNLTADDDDATYQFIAPGPVEIAVDGPPDVDFDLYVRKGQPPTEDDWDFRAFTASADEKLSIQASSGESYFIMVRSFQGAGDYTLSVQQVSM